MTDKKRTTILIIEDNPLSVQTLLEHLKKSDLETHVARSGEEAFRQMGMLRPDLILLDIMLPGIDGFEVCSRLKMNRDTQDIPVIFMTALDETADKVKAFAAGAADYITKPFDFREVTMRINTRLIIRTLQRRLQAARSAIGSTAAREVADKAKATILIVDDEAMTVHILTEYLNRAGFKAVGVKSGAEALTQVETIKPDVILLDILMPDMDGWKTCRQLKSNPATREIPVIFMTALSDMSDKVKAFEVGGADYITKPHYYAEVIARVNTHLTLQTLQRQLQETRR